MKDKIEKVKIGFDDFPYQPRHIFDKPEKNFDVSRLKGVKEKILEKICYKKR
jgi:hypothetical protein